MSAITSHQEPDSVEARLYAPAHFLEDEMEDDRALLINARGAKVGELPLPPDLDPEGILWGERFFLLFERDSGANLVYREGLLWVVPPWTEVEK